MLEKYINFEIMTTLFYLSLAGQVINMDFDIVGKFKLWTGIHESLDQGDQPTDLHLNPNSQVE